MAELDLVSDDDEDLLISWFNFNIILLKDESLHPLITYNTTYLFWLRSWLVKFRAKFPLRQLT